MKTKGEILQKLKQVRYRHLKKGIRKSLSRQPHNCTFNRKIDSILGHRVCSHPTLLDAFLSGSDLPYCDSAHGNDMSKTCEYFCPLKEKSSVKKEIQDILNSQEMGEIALHYPDVAALIWVLDERDFEDFDGFDDEPYLESVNLNPTEEEEEEEESEEVALYALQPISIDDIRPQAVIHLWWGRVKTWWKSLF